MANFCYTINIKLNLTKTKIKPQNMKKQDNFNIALHCITAIFILALAVFLLSWSSFAWAVEEKPATTSDLVNYDRLTATASSTKQKPWIELVSPSDGSIASGSLSIKAKSYGIVNKVQFGLKRSGLPPETLGEPAGSPDGVYELVWDSRKVKNGDYVIFTEAWYDWDATYLAESKNEISVSVANRIAEEEKIETPITPAEESPAAEKPIEPEKSAATAPDAATSSGSAAEAGEAAEKPEETLLDLKSIAAAPALPEECRAAGANQPILCETLMRQQYLTAECLDEGIKNRFDCNQYMQKKYGRPAQCNLLDEIGCSKLINQIILGDFVDQGLLLQANQEIKDLDGKYLELERAEKIIGTGPTSFVVKEDTATQNAIVPAAAGISALENFLPFAKTEQQLKLMILASTEAETESGLVASGVIFLDKDGDGLPDDLEKILGTDPANPDSDNDGTYDGIEIKNEQNPLGAGDYDKDLKPVVLAIVNKTSFEQPKISGETESETLQVSKVANASRLNRETSLKFSGRALAGQIASLYIYSPMPIVITVKADDNGNWVYELDKSLVDGRHEAYVVISDENGKITEKSSPFSFFVKQARAVEQTDYLAADASVPDRTDEMTIWYLAASATLVLVGIGLYFLYTRTRQKYTIGLKQ